MAVQIQRGLEIVPGYTLVRRIGSGMAGEVWVARASGGVHVAIKIIRDMEMVGSQRELGALRIVREVKHTNLCPLIGVWFFDRDGELLSNSATDGILGRESSLIDTEFLSTKHQPPSELRETHSMNLGDESTVDGILNESGIDPAEESGFAETSDLSDLSRTGSANSQDSCAENSSAFSGTAFNHNDAERAAFKESLREARQMVVAMGLGDRTLYDRLIEMRAPGNMPTEEDRLHLPGGIPAKELIRYIEGAASAIDELNLKHNIYHCDIKPQNILIVGGNSQVCDFGLARRVHESRRTQLAIGTPAYGAPEMLFDQTYTKTIDQYSLAITYYELRTGKLPFETTRRSTFLRAKAQGELQLTELPLAEQTVIAKASSLEPDERYSTCTEFVEALAAAIDTRPVVPSRFPMRLAVIGLGMATVAGVAAWALLPDLSAVRTSSSGSLSVEESIAEAKPILVDESVEDEALKSIPPAVSIEPNSNEPNSVNTTDVTTEGDEQVDPMPAEAMPADPLPVSSLPFEEIPVEAIPVVPDPVKSEVIEPQPMKSPMVSPEIEPTRPPPPSLMDLVRQANRRAEALIDLHMRTSQPLPDQVVKLNGMVEEFNEPVQIPADADLASLAELGDINPQNIRPNELATGWDLLVRSNRLPVVVIAGQLDWDAGRISSGLRKWISIQAEEDLLDLIAYPLRKRVVDRLLPWLTNQTKVSDRETRLLRYTDLVRQAEIVLSLAENLVADSDETFRRIQIEKFLLLASQQKSKTAIDLWKSLGLKDEETFAQLGHALATVVDLELTKSPTAENRIELADLRVVASQLQSRELESAVERDSVSTDEMVTFDLLLSVVEFPRTGLPEIPAKLQNSNVAKFAEHVVEILAKPSGTVGQPSHLDRFEKIERGSALALVLSQERSRQPELRLIAAEAFLQARYEQNDDVPAAQIMSRLQAYGAPDLSNQAVDLFVNARIIDQIGFLSRDEDEVLKNYQSARTMYSSVIADRSVQPDLRGSALRCRAHLLTRLAVIGDDDQKRRWLGEAADDAASSLTLPARWHGDTDDRLLTAAEVNLSTVRLLPKTQPAKIQAILEDADQFIAQSIDERRKRDLPSVPHATLRLNGYLLDLLNSSPGSRSQQRRQLAEQWIAFTATVPVTPPVDGVPQTIRTPSSRLRCHWHSMCSMVMSTLQRPEDAIAQIEYAHRIAAEQLDVTDDRRHLATLILVQLKSPPLFQSIAAGRKPDARLVQELERLLDSIVDPLPDFRVKKDLYVKELTAMAE